jgi:2-polyprenyl-3-methyl-5-hydroxy-6-metoxy-1,4-benzoquinol methylase
MSKTLDEVRRFWENNPLYSGESNYKQGTLEFFEEHRRTVINDCFAGKLDERILPDKKNRQKVLDLGCGPGFWTIELGLRGCKNIAACDLTFKALQLTKKRCEIYDINAELSQQNAEMLAFDDQEFSHVNCQGVIHHTPNTEVCVREIARILMDEGTACISVYYRNIFLRTWPLLKWIGAIIAKLGGGLRGRGRENIFKVHDVDEIVRLYDGKDNPIGKAYPNASFESMVNNYFFTEASFLHFFPTRALPFALPISIHQLLDRTVGFMIYKKLKKR